MEANIKNLIALRLRDQAEIPKTFEPLSEPISLQNETAIVQSIWEGLQGVNFFVTLEDGGAHVVFWRRMTQSASEAAKGLTRATVKTR
jgi:hypothetical protein